MELRATILPRRRELPGHQEAPEASPPPNLECHGDKVEGSGQGFLSSQEASEEAAIAAWLELAKKQDPLTKWETAGKADLSCVKQGLYSKCFALRRTVSFEVVRRHLTKILKIEKT